MTKGQRALADLTILLDTLDVKRPDIIQGWIDKIAAELGPAVTQTQECPQCNMEIGFLFEYEDAEVRYTFTVDRHGHSHSDQHDVLTSALAGYDCPECGERLFDQEADAINFLADTSV